MNILYLTNHLKTGGITSYVLSLAGGLKKRGHNIYVASSGGGLVSAFLSEGINYIPIPIMTKQEVSPKIIISFLKLLPVIKKNKIELIHSNTRTTEVLGSILSRFSGVMYVSTCHGFFKKRFSRRMFPCWGKEVIAISEPVKEHLINDFKVDEENIIVIHNGIDVNKFRGPNLRSKIEIKKELGLGDGPVVGIVARLSEEKGHIYLIEAFASVVKESPQAQLLIVGDGRTKEALVNLTKLRGLKNNIFFIPTLTDTREVLSVMDIFVLPSLKEGLGLALMEAMASGLAVIGSDIGGIRSLIKDSFNGLLVEPAEALGLSKAILILLQDAAKRESLGVNAALFIKEDFSQERMCIETESAYLKCLNAKYS